MLLKLIEEFKKRRANKGTVMEAEVNKKTKFLLKVKQTFWIIHQSFKETESSTSKREGTGGEERK